MERYAKEPTNTMIDVTKAAGRMFEQEHCRMISMVAAVDPGGSTRCVNGDTSVFRQRHQRFITALGRDDQVHEEIVQLMVKEIDLGKQTEKIVTRLRTSSLRPPARAEPHPCSARPSP